MAGSSFALDCMDRTDLAMELLDTEGLFGVQLDSDQLGVSDLDMEGLVGLQEGDYTLGVEEEAVSQLGWPSPSPVHHLESLEDQLSMDSHLEEHLSLDSPLEEQLSMNSPLEQQLSMNSPLEEQLSLSDLESHLEQAGFQEPLEEDFQKMLSEWETHIGSLATGEEEAAREEVREETPPLPAQPCGLRLAAPARASPLLSPSHRQLPVSSGLRSPVLPRPGLSYTRVAGLPSVTSRPSPSYLPMSLSPLRSPPCSPSYPRTSSSLLDTIKFSNCSSDLSTTLENQKRRMEWLESNFQRGGPSHSHASGGQRQDSKIIAAVSPGKDGQATTRILSSRSLKDTLPRELIEKIKAASQGRKTIAIIEPLNKDRPAARGRSWQSGQSGKWRHVGIVSPLQSHNISDHDYCSPGKPRIHRTAHSQHIQALKQEQLECVYSVGSNTELTFAREAAVTSPREARGRDSGLESAEMSDASEDGLYDKLPPYLTSVSVQTMTAAPEDHGYTRLPAYCSPLGTPARPVQQSVLKSSQLRQGGEEGRKLGRTVKREHSSGSSSGEEEQERRRRRRSRSGRSRSARSRSPRSRRRSQSRDRRRRSRSASSGGRRHTSSRLERREGREAREARPPYDKERERGEQERRQRQQDRQRQVEERRVVYVGRIEEGTLKDDLRRRFQVFGPIVDISVHFRDHGDNYGFVTFQYKVDAYAAVERGNDDSCNPIYDLCFGGRRAFCKEKYLDLDDVEPGAGGGGELGFDQLLEKARQGGYLEAGVPCAQS